MNGEVIGMSVTIVVFFHSLDLWRGDCRQLKGSSTSMSSRICLRLYSIALQSKGKQSTIIFSIDLLSLQK